MILYIIIGLPVVEQLLLLDFIFCDKNNFWRYEHISRIHKGIYGRLMMKLDIIIKRLRALF